MAYGGDEVSHGGVQAIAAPRLRGDSLSSGREEGCVFVPHFLVAPGRGRQEANVPTRRAPCRTSPLLYVIGLRLGVIVDFLTLGHRLLVS